VPRIGLEVPAHGLDELAFLLGQLGSWMRGLRQWGCKKKAPQAVEMTTAAPSGRTRTRTLDLTDVNRAL
jgi:hypothetical protein